jgi:hypothetical protein
MGSSGDKQMSHYYAQKQERALSQTSTCTSFSNRLAKLALRHKFYLRIVDVWTRLFNPRNPIRNKLNLIVALYECSPKYSDETKRARGVALERLKIFVLLLDYTVTLVASLILVGALYLYHIFSSAFKIRTGESSQGLQ